MATRPFLARWPGTCASCGEPFPIDTWICYHEDEIVHDNCIPDPTTSMRPVRIPRPSTTTTIVWPGWDTPIDDDVPLT